jgi:hypothetical protein
MGASTDALVRLIRQHVRQPREALSDAVVSITFECRGLRQ